MSSDDEPRPDDKSKRERPAADLALDETAASAPPEREAPGADATADTMAAPSDAVQEPQGSGGPSGRSPSQQHLQDVVKAALFDEGAAQPLGRGVVFAGRYRIERRLGQGGMGEVFLAHDLVLAEDVALKLLPPLLAKRAGYYERFVNEVRLARQVSHPSICRVHDIGEADGRPFLSMEYVDGEDLASLLKRIGRLGAEKALELSHQLCSGLAALHERGIIHRDLKPANIMLDGEGHIRIADFGLASVAAELREHEIRDGTPAYQAPEQRAGKEATERSDVYALGLVLRDMFLGRDASRTATRTKTSSATAVDETVEAVIERCLAEEPSERFASALEVLISLPGGDPLAEALAAGRLPSPDAVANTRVVGSLSALARRLLLGATIFALFLVGVLNETRSVLAQSPSEPPEVLEHRALELLEELGVEEPRSAAIRLQYRNGWLDKWQGEESPLGAVRASPESAISFHYRGFTNFDGQGAIPMQDLPVWADGDVEIVLDGRGRLSSFHQQSLDDGLELVVEDAPEQSRPSYSSDELTATLLEAAEIDPAELEEVESTFDPPVHGERIEQWSGTVRDTDAVVHAVVSDGRPGWFKVSYPELNERISVNLDGAAAIVMLMLVGLAIAVVVVSVRVAISTVRRREGDFKAARQVGIAVFVLELAAWAISAYVGDWLAIVDWLLRLLGISLLCWLGYLMLEPYARAHWPKTLVSWTRLLRGRWRDPMVGRDLLIGACAGAAMPLLFHADLGAPYAVHDLDVLQGTRFALADIPLTMTTGLQATFLLYLALLGFHRILRIRALALVAFLALVPAISLVVGGSVGTVLSLVAGAGIAAFIMLRFGLLTMVFFAFAALISIGWPITVALGEWYGPTGLVGALMVLAMAIFGARLSAAAPPMGGASRLGGAS